MTDHLNVPEMPISPLKAAGAFLRLARDNDDIDAVFQVFQHLNGNSLTPAVRRFARSAYGARLANDPDYVIRALRDEAMLAKMPPGSLGAVYREELRADGLDPEGVQAAGAALVGGGAEWSALRAECPPFWDFVQALNLTHDLFHTLTGYGRDPLGEVALQQLMTAQGAGRGGAVLAVLGGLKMRAVHPTAPVGQIMRNAKAMGLGAEDLLTTDFVPLLPLPLADVRAKLRVMPDPVYRAVKARLRRQEDVKPCARDDRRPSAPGGQGPSTRPLPCLPAL